MKINISNIRIDGGTQPREDINEDIVSEYAEAMIEGANFPPVVLFNDGAKYWLADGFHRYHASKKAGFKDIQATVESGTKRDAILYSVSANSDHGLRRTNADKRKAVLTLLRDEEWSQWSDREIARQAEVSNSFVSKLRRESGVNDSQVRKGKDGKTYDTSNIGKPKGKLLDNPSGYEEQDDGGYDIPENVDQETGEVLEDRERKGIGLQKAHEAIAKLKEIPPNDDLIYEAYDTVIKWINYNK